MSSGNVTIKKEQATQAADKAQQETSGAFDKAKEAAVHTGEAISAGASAVGQKAKEAAVHTGEAISAAASAVGQTVAHKAEDATAAVGSGMKSLGETVRDKGPHDGMMGKATDTVADALEKSGRYVEEKNLSGMADDLGNVIRKNPIPALLIGVGVGFLLGRALRS